MCARGHAALHAKAIRLIERSPLRLVMPKLDLLGAISVFPPYSVYLARVKTPALLLDGRPRALRCEKGGYAQVRALCVQEGTLHCSQNCLGPLGTGTGRTVIHKLELPGGYQPFSSI